MADKMFQLKSEQSANQTVIRIQKQRLSSVEETFKTEIKTSVDVAKQNCEKFSDCKATSNYIFILFYFGWKGNKTSTL